MNRETFFEKFEALAETEDAIPKLRKLIFQFATQGILTRQNGVDESAEVALENAWRKHGNSGRFREVMDEFNQRNDVSSLPTLPQGWCWTCNSLLGNVSPRNQEIEDDTEVAFAPMNVIPTDYRESLTPETRKWSEVKKGFTHFADGDVAIAKITPCFQNGKACAFERLSNGVGAGTTELHVIRPIAGLALPRYLLIVFSSPEFVLRGVETFSGTAGQQRVSAEFFRFHPFPLPPLAEQRRIVAKVDELMALCDELEAKQRQREERHAALARASLARFAAAPTPANLEFLFHKSYDITPADLRKTILTLAVRGKLVRQEKRIGPSLGTVPRVSDQHTLPFDIPESWQWAFIGDVAESRLGKMLDAQKNRGEPKRYLRNTNVHWFRFELESVKSMPFHASEFDDFRVEPGDVLICEGGHGIARSAVWRGQIADIMFQKALHRVRPGPLLNGDFLTYCVRVLEADGILQRYYTGAGIPHFTGRSLARVVFPLPPRAEQERIVAKVDQLMALVDRLEAELVASRAAGEKLMEAVVAELTAAGE